MEEPMAGNKIFSSVRFSFVILTMLLSACAPGGPSLAEWLSLEPMTAEAAFEMTGRLDAVTPVSLIIDGREVTVGGDTWLSPNLAVGQLVQVELVVLADGSLMALRVEPSSDGAHAGGFELTGTLTAGEGSLWTVGGVPLVLPEGAQVGAGIAVGTTVHVEGTIGSDGQLMITEVSVGDADQDANEADEPEDEDEAEEIDEAEDTENDAEEACEAEDAESEGAQAESGDDAEDEDDADDGDASDEETEEDDDGDGCGGTDHDEQDNDDEQEDGEESADED
jgi:hypothetical protein